MMDCIYLSTTDTTNNPTDNTENRPENSEKWYLGGRADELEFTPNPTQWLFYAETEEGEQGLLQLRGTDLYLTSNGLQTSPEMLQFDLESNETQGTHVSIQHVDSGLFLGGDLTFGPEAFWF